MKYAKTSRYSPCKFHNSRLCKAFDSRLLTEEAEKAFCRTVNFRCCPIFRTLNKERKQGTIFDMFKQAFRGEQQEQLQWFEIAICPMANAKVCPAYLVRAVSEQTAQSYCENPVGFEFCPLYIRFQGLMGRLSARRIWDWIWEGD